jgi:hypothetical protein
MRELKEEPKSVLPPATAERRPDRGHLLAHRHRQCRTLPLDQRERRPGDELRRPSTRHHRSGLDPVDG